MTNNSIEQQLTQSGWNVKSEFFPSQNLKIDAMKKLLLDTDIKVFGEKSLPDLSRLEQLGKVVIVQLHKTRNVTAPKDNESSSHRSQLYRLILTDGHVFQNALILPSLRNFNLETPPGVKLLLKPQTKLSNGFYILNDQNCEILGGNVVELVQKWKLNKLMGKHVRTLVGEGAPPPWVPFGTRLNASAVDTSQRSMDVAKSQQSNEEDPEFVRLRRAAIDQLVNDQGSKVQRFARQDVMRATNVAKGFGQIQQQKPVERPTTAPTTAKSTNNPTAAAAAIRANTRLPEWAKNQIADEPVEEDPRRKNYDDSDDRRGRFGRQRRNEASNEETKPSKDVTLFDFVSAKPTPPPKATAPAMKSSQNVQKPSFAYQNGDQILARYHEDNEYYPAVIMNINQAKQQCQVMFEGYESYEIVQFADVEPFEEGYYEEDYGQKQQYAYQHQQQQYRNYHY